MNQAPSVRVRSAAAQNKKRKSRGASTKPLRAQRTKEGRRGGARGRALEWDRRNKARARAARKTTPDVRAHLIMRDASVRAREFKANNVVVNQSAAPGERERMSGRERGTHPAYATRLHGSRAAAKD